MPLKFAVNPLPTPALSSACQSLVSPPALAISMVPAVLIAGKGHTWAKPWLPWLRRVITVHCIASRGAAGLQQISAI